jgi:hypothetical protein
MGRKATYYTFFLLGIALYAAAPSLAHAGNKSLFVLAFGIILSMYGGGFATAPAYLADVFGTQFVGAIHGRLDVINHDRADNAGRGPRSQQPRSMGR